MQRIGFIGLGAMGAPMAQRIQQHRGAAPLVIHARRKESTAALRAGAVWADSPADLAGHVDVVVTMLPDLPELRDVCTPAAASFLAPRLPSSSSRVQQVHPRRRALSAPKSPRILAASSNSSTRR